jgi:enoyl-CoA hydratase/carnithine racemase
MSSIKLEVIGDKAVIRLDRGKVNAINADVIHDLTQAVLELKADEKIRGVMITGKSEFFSAGLDVVELYGYNEEQILNFWRDYDRLLRLMIAFPKPLVAAINGHCSAGGCLLTLGCDYRVMASGNYRIGLNEVALGIVIPETVYHLYSFAIGRNKAYQYLLEGKMHTPEEALSCGLIHELLPLEQVESHAHKQLDHYLKFSTAVWAQSKLNFRSALLQKIRTDFQTTFEHTIRQWWSEESRGIIAGMIAKLKG